MRTAMPLLLAAALLAGCGDDGPDTPSTFTGELTGAYTESLTGEARYGIGRLNDQSGFVVVLGDGSAARVTLVTPSNERRPVGTYEIVAFDDPEAGAKFTGEVGYTSGNALLEFEVRGGTLAITASEPGRVAGTVELRAVQTFPCCPETPAEVFLTGAFDARAY